MKADNVNKLCQILSWLTYGSWIKITYQERAEHSNTEWESQFHNSRATVIFAITERSLDALEYTKFAIMDAAYHSKVKAEFIKYTDYIFSNVGSSPVGYYLVFDLWFDDFVESDYKPHKEGLEAGRRFVNAKFLREQEIS